MSTAADIARAPAVDLLAEATEQVRPLLLPPERSLLLKLKILWIAARKARDLGSADVVADVFFRLAIDVGMIDGVTGHWLDDAMPLEKRVWGGQDTSHVLHWAVRNRNPFAEPPA